MNYAATYCALISKRLRNPIKKCGNGTVETHHIIPRSEGGLDEKDNLVNLTTREHYVAHLLLAKIYDDYKMWGAVQTMTVSNGLQSRRITYNSRLYEHARKMYLKRRKARPAPHGWKQTPEWIAKRTAHHIGVPRSEESKEKQR